MPKYGLIGKNISHSKSPAIYHNLLGNKIHYDLLDYQSAADIPELKELFSNYNGLNITSPYKRHFIQETILSASANKLKAINCLKTEAGKFYGENTDYLATIDILKKFEQDCGKPIEVIILGDGVMSQVCQLAVKDCGMSSKVLSRRMTANFDHLKLLPEKQTTQLLVINSCSRDYTFKGAIDKQTIFWDLNYNFESHQIYLSERVKKYVDGLGLLELQAKYAVAFWSDN